jgi:putative oxidoreductase
MAVLFLLSGIGKLAVPAAAQGQISAAGLPLPMLAYGVAVLIEVGGGLMLVVGFRTRLAAFATANTAMATAVFFHRNFADPNQMVHFLKNIAIAGGLLQVAAFGGGSFSLDSRVDRRPVLAS